MTYSREVTLRIRDEEVLPLPTLIHNKRFTKPIPLTSTLDTSLKKRKVSFFEPKDEYNYFCRDFERLSKKRLKKRKTDDDTVIIGGHMEPLEPKYFPEEDSKTKSGLVRKITERLRNLFRKRKDCGHLSECDCSEQNVNKMFEYYEAFEKCRVKSV